MKNLIALAPLLLLLLTACVTRYTIQPVVQPGQTTAQVQGGQVAESGKKHTVSVRHVQNEVRRNERLQFLVMVGNRGNDPFAFSLANVEVKRNDSIAKTYSLEEQQAEIIAIANMQQAVAMGQAMSAQMNAGFAQTSLNNATRPGVGANYAVQQLNTARDYAQQAVQQQNMASTMSIMSSASATQLGGLGCVLQYSMVKPGQTVGGVVTTDGVKKSGPHTLKLKVDAAGEAHEFEFLVHEIGSR